MSDNKMVTVINRSTSVVSYVLEEMGGLRREFFLGEGKILNRDEVFHLINNKHGGRRLALDYLKIMDEQLLNELGIYVEPEYWYGEEEIKDLLGNKSLDALKDCLDFAPRGVIDLIVKIAVDLEINDLDKRNAITEKTGRSINSMIANKEDGSDAEIVAAVSTTARERRVPIN